MKPLCSSVLNLPRKLSKNWLLLQCLSPVLSQPRSFAVNMTNLKLMTHTSNTNTTQSHSAATETMETMPRCSVTIQSWLEWPNVSMRIIRIEKKLGKKSSNSEFQCSFKYTITVGHICMILKVQNSFLHFSMLQMAQTMQRVWSIFVNKPNLGPLSHMQ